MTTQTLTTKQVWTLRADELAQWTLDHLANRTDALVAFLRQDKRTGEEDADIVSTVRQTLTLALLTRHYIGKEVNHLIGLHSISPTESSRWFAIDVDKHGHDDPTTPGDNFQAALGWSERLKTAGFRPIVMDTNGSGGYRVLVVLDDPASTTRIHAYLSKLVSDYADHQLYAPPRVCPSQDRLDGDQLGDWMPLPGRHHTHSEYWTKVYDNDANRWLEGQEAIQALLATRGDSIRLLPKLNPAGAHGQHTAWPTPESPAHTHPSEQGQPLAFPDQHDDPASMDNHPSGDLANRLRPLFADNADTPYAAPPQDNLSADNAHTVNDTADAFNPNPDTPPNHPVETEVLGHILQAAANGSIEPVFALTYQARLTPEAFELPANRLIYETISRLYADQQSLTHEHIASQAPPDRQLEAHRQIQHLTSQPAISERTFEQHLAVLAKVEEQPEPAHGSSPMGWSFPPNPSTNSPSQTPSHTRSPQAPSNAKRVLSQAERWETYSRRLNQDVKVIPVESAFRLRSTSLSAALTDGEDPRAVEHRRAGKHTFANALNGGLYPGQVMTIAGQAGAGKSSLSLQLADSIAAENASRSQHGMPVIPVLYVSLDMDGYEMMELSLTRMARVPADRVRTGAYRQNPHDLASVDKARNQYLDAIAPWLRVMDSEFFAQNRLDVDTIRQQIDMAKADFGVQTVAVFIDPANKLLHASPADRNTGRNTDRPHLLHDLAKQEGIAVIAVENPAPSLDNPAGWSASPYALSNPAALSYLATATIYVEVSEFAGEYAGNHTTAMPWADPDAADPLRGDLPNTRRRLEAAASMFSTPPVGPEGTNQPQDFDSRFVVVQCATRKHPGVYPLVFRYHRAIRSFEELPV